MGNGHWPAYNNEQGVRHLSFDSDLRPIALFKNDLEMFGGHTGPKPGISTLCRDQYFSAALEHYSTHQACAQNLCCSSVAFNWPQQLTVSRYNPVLSEIL